MTTRVRCVINCLFNYELAANSIFKFKTTSYKLGQSYQT